MTKNPLALLRPAAPLLLATLFLPARALAQPAPPPPPPDLPPSQPAPPTPPLAQPVPAPASRVPAPMPFPGTPLAPSATSPLPSSDAEAVPKPPEPAPPVPARIPGVTAKGLPLAQRGGIIAEVAGLLTSTSGSSGGTGSPIAAIDLVVRIPVADHTFVDADLPIGFGALGNPMVGAHHVFRPLDRLWLTLGGAFGFPLINDAALESFAAATAFWDAERFMAYKMPFALRLGLEGHAGAFEFRVQADPVWGISIASCPQFGCTDSRDVHFAAFQHALEIQAGHEIAGGVRYQGVFVGTNNPSLVGVDNSAFGGSGPQRYQGAIEPFFRLYHDPIFFRLGLLLPVDNPLGAPFDHTWGVRAATGFSID